MSLYDNIPSVVKVTFPVGDGAVVFRRKDRGSLSGSSAVKINWNWTSSKTETVDFEMMVGGEFENVFAVLAALYIATPWLLTLGMARLFLLLRLAFPQAA